MDDLAREGLKGGGAEWVDREFDVFEDCGLDGHVIDGVVGLVDVGCEELCGVLALFYAINPDLHLRVVIGKDFVGVVVDDRLETNVCGNLGLSLGLSLRLGLRLSVSQQVETEIVLRSLWRLRRLVESALVEAKSSLDRLRI